MSCAICTNAHRLKSVRSRPITAEVTLDMNRATEYISCRDLFDVCRLGRDSVHTIAMYQIKKLNWKNLLTYGRRYVNLVRHLQWCTGIKRSTPGKKNTKKVWINRWHHEDTSANFLECGMHNGAFACWPSGPDANPVMKGIFNWNWLNPNLPKSSAQ